MSLLANVIFLKFLSHRTAQKEVIPSLEARLLSLEMRLVSLKCRRVSLERRLAPHATCLVFLETRLVDRRLHWPRSFSPEKNLKAEGSRPS